MADGSPPTLDNRKTRDLLRQSSASFAAAAPPLLAAAVLLLSFRSALLAGTLRLNAAIDKSLVLLSFDPPNDHPSATLPPHRIDNDEESDFFSVPDDRLASDFNHTFIFLGGSQKPLKIRLNFFPPPSSSPIFFSLNEHDDDAKIKEAASTERNKEASLAVLYLIAVLSSAHTLAVLGFVLTYALALGTVFFAVTTSRYLGKPNLSLARSLLSGARMGLRRLTGSLLLRWSLRDAFVQLLCVCFLSRIAGRPGFFSLLIKAKLMPFSLTAPFPLLPWFDEGDGDPGLFFYVWATADMLSSVALAVSPFVVLMDHGGRRRGRDLAREGLYLVSLMLPQALSVKLLETLACGKLGRWALARMGGTMFAMMSHSVLEVYFMVVWLTFYLAARCKDGELGGRRFGRADLEDCIDGLG